MPEPTMTPAEMREEAERLEKQAAAMTAAMTARAQQLRNVADQIDRLQRAVSTGDLPGGLTSDADSTNLHGVNASASSAKLARGMARSRTKKHPFVKLLYEKQRMTITEWARRHGLKSGTVATWVAKPDAASARRIPRETANMIEKELGLPATLATWKNGITEPE